MKRLIIIPVCAVLLSACGDQAAVSAGNDPVQEETPVTAAVPDETPEPVNDAVSGATNVSSESAFNGTLVIPPQSHASVTLSIDGIVQSTNLLSGKYVRKGEVLATLENPEFITLQQDYLESSAQAHYLETEYRRQEVLAKEEVASQKKFEQSKADYLSMKSRQSAAAARLRMLGIDPEKLTPEGIIPRLEVRAPISGYVSAVRLNLGKHVPAGDPLCEIVDKNQAMLRLTAYEKDLDRIRIGDPVEFRVNGMGDEVFRGSVISVGQQVDDVNRSLEVYARVDKADSRFRPGMYVNARTVQK